MMSTDPMKHFVYAWVAHEWRPVDVPRTLPAIRLWGDVILELIAEADHLQTTPPIGMRRTSIFAWPTRVPPQDAAVDTVQKRRVRLEVSSPQCACARVALVQALFDPGAWKRLGAWLTDRGHDPDFIEEDVVVFADPMAQIVVERARAAVESTSDELLQEILAYFHPAASAYLGTWSPLVEASDLDGMEIVVPASAIITIEG